MDIDSHPHIIIEVNIMNGIAGMLLYISPKETGIPPCIPLAMIIVFVAKKTDTIKDETT